MLLKIENSSKYFGGVAANKDVNIVIDNNQTVGLIGPNGAGKSTLFKSVSGFNKIDEGEIYLGNTAISKWAPYKISKNGIASTFQHAQLFANLSLEESVLAGAYCHEKSKKKALEIAHKQIEFVGLKGKEKTIISKLNMFQRKSAELAAALATQPKLLLLDELFAGLVPTEVELMIEQVRKIQKLNISLFIVEHVLKAIMDLCDVVYVMEYGKIIAHGSPQEVTHNPLVIAAYLGDDYNAS